METFATRRIQKQVFYAGFCGIMDFQTPKHIARYMVEMIPEGTVTVLEPTPGEGNIVKLLDDYFVTAPSDFFKMETHKFDCIVMNPPFSSKSAFGFPEGEQYHGMKLGYTILNECMKMSDNLIALMPWLTIADSDVRLRKIKKFGLKSVTLLPRKTFEYARIQTVVLNMQQGYKGETKFLVYEEIIKNKQLSFI